MTTLSATEIAISGLRLTAREPKTVLVWSGLGFVVSLASLAGMTLLAGAASGAGAGGSNAITLWKIFSTLAWYGVLFAFALLAMAIFAGPVFRAVLRPEQRGFAYLRLGRDELRLVLVFALLAVIIVATAIAASAAAMALAALLFSVFRVAGWILFLNLLPIVPLSVAAWLGVRLWLVAPMAFAEGGIPLRRGWRLTRGRFWPLLGGLALSCLILAAIAAVVFALRTLVAAAVGGVGVGEGYVMVMRPGEGLAAIFAPARIAALAAGSLLSGLFYAVALAPAAVAYRSLRPSQDVAFG